MYAVDRDTPLDPTLAAHLASPFVQSVQFNDDFECYTYVKHGVRVHCGGLINKVRREYYPHYKRTRRRRKTNKKGSSTVLGKRVDNQVEAYLTQRTKPGNVLARRVLHYLLKEQGHTLQACQVPVFVKRYKCVTQVDLLTLDAKDRLWMWELKTGYPNMRSQGTLKKLDVRNSRLSHWELQRHYTALALKQHKVNVYKSAVLHVYSEYKPKEKRTVVSIKARRAASWSNKIK